MNTQYKITLQLFFKKTDPEEVLILEEDREEEIRKQMIEDFAEIDRTDFVHEAHLKKYDINEFIEGVYYDYGKIISARWLEDLKIEFIYEFYEPTTLEQVHKDLLTNSLEDGAYEGNSGWIVFTERKYEYGLYDYRREDCITIEAL